MKIGGRILCGSLLGLSVTAPAAAMPIESRTEDGTPILSASIVAQFEMGIADNDDSAGSASTRDGGFVNGRFAEVFFNGELTADNGLVYGARIHFATGGDGSAASNVSTAEFPGQEYIYLQGTWGSVEMGNWPGADSTLNLCPVCNTYAGYGGLDTPWASYAIDPHAAVGAAGPGFRNYPSNANWFAYGTKITYYTPIVYGLQLGVSYLPTSASPNASGPFVSEDGAFKDVFEFGAKYDTQVGPVAISVSAVGAVSDGDLEPSAVGVAGLGLSQDRDVTGLGAWEIGALVSYEGFQLGGSYWNDGNSGALKNRDFGFESDGWTLDAAYFFGPWGIELQYVESHRAGASRIVSQAHANLIRTGSATGVLGTDVVGDASTLTETYDFTGYALSLGYDVAPGLKWYGEIVHFDYDFTRAAAVAAGSANDLDLDNHGLVFLSGIVLSF